MSLPRQVDARGVSQLLPMVSPPRACYLPGGVCDDKIALLEYTMAGEETSGLDGVDEQIDVRGMLCPLPVLKARKRLKTLNNGAILRVLASDPAAVIDFPHFCSEAGHELISSNESDGILTFVIRKSHAT